MIANIAVIYGQLWWKSVCGQYPTVDLFKSIACPASIIFAGTGHSNCRRTIADETSRAVVQHRN